jgi:hypothetical protein
VSESGEDISKTVDSTSIDGDRAGQLNISRTDVNMAQGGTEFGTPTRFTGKMGKGKLILQMDVSYRRKYCLFSKANCIVL